MAVFAFYSFEIKHLARQAELDFPDLEAKPEYAEQEELFREVFSGKEVSLWKTFRRKDGSYDKNVQEEFDNEILVKRILLHYKDDEGQTFWKQTSPYYDRNYETSSWKRIVRCGAFLKFYKEISREYTLCFSCKDLVELLETKRKEFYSILENRSIKDKKWSDRRLAILMAK